MLYFSFMLTYLRGGTLFTLIGARRQLRTPHYKLAHRRLEGRNNRAKADSSDECSHLHLPPAATPGSPLDTNETEAAEIRAPHHQRAGGNDPGRLQDTQLRQRRRGHSFQSFAPYSAHTCGWVAV